MLTTWKGAVQVRGLHLKTFSALLDWKHVELGTISLTQEIALDLVCMLMLSFLVAVTLSREAVL